MYVHAHEFFTNGVNLKIIQAKNIYAYRLALIVTKQELSKSFLKSSKPALPQEKVQQIIGKITAFDQFVQILHGMTLYLYHTALMKKQFPNDPSDLNVVTQKANQRCCDAAGYIQRPR